MDGLQCEGYQVEWQSTGNGGVDYAASHAIHLMILDVRLPDGTGFDWCRKIRQLGMRQPIIMLTVRGDEVDKILGLEIGADDYVTKPCFRELLSCIKAQFRWAYREFASRDSNLIYVGDVVIDRQRGIVLKDNQEIYLTPIEFRLFVYLAQHPNQALARAQILEAVWGHDVTTESDRSINSHIRRLREKVEIDPSNPQLIQTVLGIGYRLIP
jgi:DNA-binding response OmpR family regulator